MVCKKWRLLATPYIFNRLSVRHDQELFNLNSFATLIGNSFYLTRCIRSICVEGWSHSEQWGSYDDLALLDSSDLAVILPKLLNLTAVELKFLRLPERSSSPLPLHPPSVKLVRLTFESLHCLGPVDFDGIAIILGLFSSVNELGAGSLSTEQDYGSYTGPPAHGLLFDESMKLLQQQGLFRGLTSLSLAPCGEVELEAAAYFVPALSTTLREIRLDLEDLWSVDSFLYDDDFGGRRAAIRFLGDRIATCSYLHAVCLSLALNTSGSQLVTDSFDWIGFCLPSSVRHLTVIVIPHDRHASLLLDFPWTDFVDILSKLRHLRSVAFLLSNSADGLSICTMDKDVVRERLQPLDDRGILHLGRGPTCVESSCSSDS